MTGQGRAVMEFFYPESRFGGFTQVDGTLAFYTHAQALVGPESVVIDFGCGRGAYGSDPLPLRRDMRIFKGKVQRVIGLDASPAGAENPFLDEFHSLENNHWPLPDAAADLIVCDNVLEHLPEPDVFFAEAWRALKPGGSLCIRTPNRWNYIALLSRLVPNHSHTQVLAKAKPGLAEKDIFPTFYRCNSLRAVRRALAKHGFDAVVYGYEAEPSYLSFSKAAYAVRIRGRVNAKDRRRFVFKSLRSHVDCPGHHPGLRAGAVDHSRGNQRANHGYSLE